MLANQMQDVRNNDIVAFVGDLPYQEVRAEQLHAPAKTGFSSPFLYFVQNHLLDAIYERLKASGDSVTEQMVDTLVMLIMLNGKVEFNALTGLDEETLTDVLAQSTRLVDWQ